MYILTNCFINSSGLEAWYCQPRKLSSVIAGVSDVLLMIPYQKTWWYIFAKENLENEKVVWRWNKKRCYAAYKICTPSIYICYFLQFIWLMRLTCFPANQTLYGTVVFNPNCFPNLFTNVLLPISGITESWSPLQIILEFNDQES